MNSSTLAMHAAASNSIVLDKNIAAFKVLSDDNGRSRMGTSSHLPKGSLIEICGAGFSERTVQIKSGDAYYFVLMKALISKLTLS